ncbi:MAG: gamma-glutamyltransferase, partial [Pirellulaceae bacterium]|nr:gamma-glutamyltransferase [Pirellulaceae bacterium]
GASALATASSRRAMGADPTSLPTNVAVAAKGMVASVHPLATDAGVAALKRGGNAIDAAIATALTLGVVDGHNSGIGGGCFILIRCADGYVAAIDGRETAPAAATRDMYLREGKPQGELSVTGPLAVATPGALAAYGLAHENYGKLPLRDLVRPAAEIAERGFPIDRIYARNIKSTQKSLAMFPASRELLLKKDGSPLVEGDILKQPDLARILREIVDRGGDGIDWFYHEIAGVIAKWMKENGGILTADDFANFRPIMRTPISTTYRGRTIVGFPPPSSGGVHVAQILNILENFDLKSIYQKSPGEFTHIVAEAMKLAFADRAYWLGDPAFAKVPHGLVDKNYAKELAAKINPKGTIKVPKQGQPPAWQSDVFAKHTTHIATADAAGNWVALTQTINTSFGSKVIVPGTGVFLNNEMDDFSIAPGKPNAFGLVGAEANAVEPLKRPLSSMSPTIILEGDQPVMTLGAAGGPTIISQVLLAIVRHFDLDLSLEDSLAQPRFHHQWSPDELRVETAVADDLKKDLEARGHKLKAVAAIGTAQGIVWDEKAKHFRGVHDPRVPGKAAGP